MFKKDLLKDKNILVTGGGTGLGKEMATHYAEHGANIFICGRRENVLKDTANEIMDNHGVSVRNVLIPPVSYTHLRAHETPEHLVCRLLLEKKNKKKKKKTS